MHLGQDCPNTIQKHRDHFVGAVMHSDVLIDFAGTDFVPASPLSFASNRAAFYRDETFFETWLPYTGVRP